MTSLREAAVATGFYVFRLRVGHNEDACDGGTANCKTLEFFDSNWKTASTNDPDVIRSWDWSGANAYGIDCGKSGILVADEDPGSTWPFNGTRVHSTGRGYHHFYEDLIGIHNRTKVQPWGVDVRGVGGFVLGPLSYHPHGEYRSRLDIPMDAPPEALIQECQRQPEPSELGPFSELDALDALPRLEGVYRRMQETAVGERNDTLNKLSGLAAGIWVRLDPDDQVGELSEDTIKQRLLESVPDDDDPRGSQATVESGWGYGVNHPVADDLETLKHAIFDATPTLQHIRQAAYSRLLGSGSLLCCVLGRVLLEVPPALKIPPIVASRASLNLGFAFVGESGDGKSGVVATSADLFDLEQEFMKTAPGSGEGLIDAFIEEVRVPDPNDPSKTIKEKRLADPPSRYFDVDEIGRMGAIKGREGSTLFSMLRTALTGGSLQTSNATAGGRSRRVDAGSYRLISFVGIQPELSDILLGDVNAGTPQRFVWVSVLDKTTPEDTPDWPGVLDWSPVHLEFLDGDIVVPEFIQTEVRDSRREVLRGGGDPIKGHILLTKIKVAAALAFLHGEVQVTEQWWRLAGMIIEWSLQEQSRCRATLARARDHINEMKGRASGKQELEKERVIAEDVSNRVREKVLTLAAGDGVTMRDLKNRLSRAQKNVLDYVLEDLRGQVRVVEEGAGGHQKRKRVVVS